MANIDFVCRAEHSADPTHPANPTITLNEGLWAYCLRGGDEHHTWVRVPKTTVAQIELEMAAHRIVVQSAVEPRPTRSASARRRSTP